MGDRGDRAARQGGPLALPSPAQRGRGRAFRTLAFPAHLDGKPQAGKRHRAGHRRARRPRGYRREYCPRNRKWNGANWLTQTTPTSNDLHDIWGPVGNARLAWLVANAGVIARWDGTSWTLQTNGTGVNLYGVWGTDQSNVWAVGDFGTIAKWNGATWIKQMTSGPTANNFGIWGTGTDNIWVVGAAGTILRWNGTAWTKQTSPTTSELRGIWGVDANNIWAVGAGGTILRWGP